MALTSNAAHKAGNGLGSRTQIISSATIADQAALDTFGKAIAALGHTIAAVDGAHGGTMHFAIQGGPLPIAAGAYAGETVAAVCDFEEA